MATVSAQAAPTVTAIDVADPTLTAPVPAQPISSAQRTKLSDEYQRYIGGAITTI